MGSLVKTLNLPGRVASVKTAWGQATFLEAMKAGGYKALLHGNLAETILVHGPQAEAKHVGTDYNGNKYYENNNEQFGRHRWVVYANLDIHKGLDSCTIPPEWHRTQRSFLAFLSATAPTTGWIQAITDTPPSVEAPQLPIYHINATANPTGTMKAYKPKGDWWNPKQRNWLKYERWQPPTQ